MGQCEEVLGFSLGGFLSHESVNSFAFAVIGVVTALGSVLYLYRQRNLAHGGASGAGSLLIFPIYFNILVALAISDVYHAGINIAYSQEKVVLATPASKAQAASMNGLLSQLSVAYVLYALSYAFIHLISEGIAVLLMRRGLGSEDVRFAVKCGAVWGLVTAVLMVVADLLPPTGAFAVRLIWNLCMLLFYSVLWLAPNKTIFRRPALIPYACYWAVLRLIIITSVVLVDPVATGDAPIDSGYCLNIVATALLYLSFAFIAWFTLLADCHHWQVGKNLNI
jgi:hypothetical protein